MASATPVIRAASSQVGEWCCARKLGEGSWSETWQARPASSESSRPADYVIKLARREKLPLAGQMLAREAEIGSQIRHPHVVSVFSVDLDHDPPYLVMPFVGYVTLERVFEMGRPIQLARAIWIVRQAADGLRALHRAGWIHADVQPNNLVLSREGHLTLIDLGLARHRQAAGLASNELAGRLPYMAPEMISSALTANPASDIYSLGVVFFQLLTGKLPFEAKEAADWINAHLRRRPCDPRTLQPGLPSEVASLVLEMLAKQDVRRPAADTLIDQLAQFEITHFADRV